MTLKHSSDEVATCLGLKDETYTQMISDALKMELLHADPTKTTVVRAFQQPKNG